MIADGLRRKPRPGAGLLTAPELVFALPGATTLEEQVTQFFELLREPLYHYLLVVLSQAAEAEDLTQDVFLQFYQALRAGQTIEQPRLWLFRVAHNLALNRVRRRAYQETQAPLAWAELAQLLPDPAPNPERVAMAREEFRRVHHALALLSPQETHCLHLRVEGFRYREIAQILGLALPSVAEFVRRALKKLQAK